MVLPMGPPVVELSASCISCIREGAALFMGEIDTLKPRWLLSELVLNKMYKTGES